MKNTKTGFVVAAMLLAYTTINAQSKLYPQLFDLQDVQITGGPFLHAQVLNCHTLLEYDLGRLMQPYEAQAGLPESGKPFANIHESRYMLYWLNVDENKWNAMKAEKKAQEATAQKLEARTIDYVNIGTQQSESDHFMQQSHCRWHCYSYSKAFWWSCRIHQQGIHHS